LFAPFEL